MAKKIIITLLVLYVLVGLTTGYLNFWLHFQNDEDGLRIFTVPYFIGMNGYYLTFILSAICPFLFYSFVIRPLIRLLCAERKDYGTKASKI